MLVRYRFFDSLRNPAGHGVRHGYRLTTDSQIVFDATTGRYWQRGGSLAPLPLTEAQTYVEALNTAGFGGFTNWRLPTLEEAMSLMERRQADGDLHLDSLFDRVQWWIWTADHHSGSRAWVVYFHGASCFTYVVIRGSSYVRAVRSEAT